MKEKSLKTYTQLATLNTPGKSNDNFNSRKLIKDVLWKFCKIFSSLIFVISKVIWRLKHKQDDIEQKVTQHLPFMNKINRD